MTVPKNFINDLTKLTVAAATARDLGYVHTARVLDQLMETEKARLRDTIQVSIDSLNPLSQTI